MTFKLFTRSLCALLVAVSFTSCSGIGRAVVTEVDGQPCFSIEKNWTTRNGLPMYGLLVSAKEAHFDNPDEYYIWRFDIQPPGKSIPTLPGKCMRYGATPALATQHVLKPLEPYTVYHVFIDAKSDGPIFGYKADFCIKPSEPPGKRVFVVPFDEKSSQWRYDLCARPAPASDGYGLIAPVPPYRP